VGLWLGSCYHIIRNDAEFKRITAYIENNPSKWKNENFL